jgi:hypothetical protein
MSIVRDAHGHFAAFGCDDSFSDVLASVLARETDWFTVCRRFCRGARGNISNGVQNEPRTAHRDIGDVLLGASRALSTAGPACSVAISVRPLLGDV